MADQDPKNPNAPDDEFDPLNPGRLNATPNPAFAAPAIPVPVDPAAEPPVTATTPNPGPQRRAPRAERTDGTGRPLPVGTVRERAQARIDRIGEILKNAVKNMRSKDEAEPSTAAPAPVAEAKPADKPIDATEAPTSVVEAPPLATTANPAVDTTPTTAKSETPKKGALATMRRVLNAPVYDGTKTADGKPRMGPLERWTDFLGFYPYGETGKTRGVMAFMQVGAVFLTGMMLIEFMFQPLSNYQLFAAFPKEVRFVLAGLLTLVITWFLVKLDVGAYIQAPLVRLPRPRNPFHDPDTTVDGKDATEQHAIRQYRLSVASAAMTFVAIYALRVVVMFMITAYNTAAVERVMNASAIKMEAKAEEAVNREAIKARALASENPAPNAAGVCESNRCRQRVALDATHNTERTRLTTAVTEARRVANLEASGFNIDGQRVGRGPGPSYQAKLADLRRLETELREFGPRATSEIAAFDHETEQRLTALRTMDPDRMATQYGGVWRVNLEGIAEQDRILTKIMNRDANMKQTRNRYRVFFFMIQGLALAWSLFKPKAVRDYLHTGHRAMHGDKEAITELAQLGITDPSVTTFLPGIVELGEHAYDRFAALTALAKIVRKTLKTLARTRNANGQHLSLEQIETTVAAAWAPSEKILQELALLERAFKRAGATIPNWPADLNRDRKGMAHDLRLPENDPSVVTKAGLIEKHGWVDPETHEVSLRALNEELESVRDQVIAGIVAMDRESGRMMRDAIPAPAIVLRYTRGEKFENEILPLYFEMERLEREIKKNGGTVSDWDFKNRVGLKCSPTDLDVVEAYARAPSDNELRAISGGQLAQPGPTPVAAPLPTPAPVTPPAAPTTPPPGPPPAEAKAADDTARGPGNRNTTPFGTPVGGEAQKPVEPKKPDEPAAPLPAPGSN